MSKRLQKLGAEVARIQDEGLSDGQRRAVVRRRLLADGGARAGEAASRERSSRWLPVLAWAGAMAAIALAIVALWPRVAEPIAYHVEGGAESRGVGRSITAPNDRSMSIGFTDGSAVQLGPSARARVRQLRTDGATLTLDRGEATVTVRHRKATRWSVEAGPFLVRVTGTRFRVRWQPKREAFDLEVFEGEVRVSGPDLLERILRDGDEVHRSLAPEPESPPPIQKPEPPPPIVDPVPAPRQLTKPSSPPRNSSPPSARPLELKLPPKEPSTELDARAPSQPPKHETTREMSRQHPQEQSEPPTEASAAEAPSEPAWKTLIDRGHSAELLTTVGPEQVEQALWQAGPNQLIDLGAAARELGDARAGHIYSVVRSRFPSTEAAADAAFLLGRMQFHSGAYRVSATWFETYLQERPDGRFAREAAGRLLEAYHQGGDQERSREAAQQYLRRHPNGPHASLARSVLR